MRGRKLQDKIYILLVLSLLAVLMVPPEALGASTSMPPASSQNNQLDAETWSAQGRLVPRSWVNLSFPTGGLVDQVLVKEGDRVEAGASLATLGGQEKIAAQIAASELELLNAQQALDELNRNARVALAQANLNLAELQKAEQRLQDKVDSLTQPVDPRRIQQAYANMLLAKKALDNLRHDQEKLERLLNDKDNIIWRFFKSYPFKLKLMYLKLQVSRADTRYQDAVDKYNDLQEPANAVDLGQARADLALATSQVQQAIQDRDKLVNGPDPDELMAAQARLHAAEAALQATQAANAHLQIAAPFAGQVFSIPAKENQWTQAGQPALILADESGWLVEIDDLQERLVPAVQIGQPVSVTFDALPGQTLNGEVESVSLVNGEKNEDPVYMVKIALEQTDPQLRWGMTARVRSGNQ
jgi:HlyD family secretion protein